MLSACFGGRIVNFCFKIFKGKGNIRLPKCCIVDIYWHRSNKTTKNKMESHKEKSRVAILSVYAAVLLVLFKAVVGIATGSLGILSEALHSALDFVSAAITYVSVKISDKPADRDHNFGHGKVENLSALSEALLLFITCGWIIWEALSRLLSGETHIEVGFWSFAVVCVSIAVDVTRSRSLMKAAKKYNSQALEADALHFSTDIWSSAVVLLGLICASFGLYWADSVAALGVAFIVIWISARLAKRAINQLVDKAPDGMREVIAKIIRQTDGVEKWHALRVRSAGAEYEVDVNIHVKRNLSIVEAHEIAENVENRMKERLGKKALINVHVEPDD